LKTVLISAYTCCPNRGSEPGNGWNWLMEYLRNGFEVHCVTSDRYVHEIETFCKENKIENIFFYFSSFKKTTNTKNIPLVGDYIHYYLWLIKARPIIKSISKKYFFNHAHHVTYSSIKFGTPLYNLNMKVVLGPLGGGELPDKSLKKYLGKSYYFESFKYLMGDFLSFINPTVSSSIKSAACILVSNEIAAKIIRKHTAIQLTNMFDAGLSDNFKNEFIERDINSAINILWIGRMLPRKGLNLAIEAIAQLPKELNFHFFIVGDGPLRETLEATVLKYGLQSKVTFEGKLQYNLLQPVYKKSHLLLFPSLIDSCPMQVFEAMAYSMPIVTLNHQGMKDQVTTDTGVKIDIGNNVDYPKLLADGILNLISDELIYRKKARHAFKFGQEQIWSYRIEKFIKESL